MQQLHIESYIIYMRSQLILGPIILARGIDFHTYLLYNKYVT